MVQVACRVRRTRPFCSDQRRSPSRTSRWC